MNTQLIKETHIDLLKKRISDLLIRLYAITGTEKSKDDHLVNLQSFLCEITTTFKYLTIEDIEKACTHGATGHYGDFHGINCKSLCGFLRVYKTDLKPQTTNLIAEKSTLTDIEKEEIMENACIECFEEYKLKTDINKGAVSLGKRISNLYKYLKTKGLINYDDEKLNEIKEIAKKNILKDTGNRLYKVSAEKKLNDINECNDIIKAIMQGERNKIADLNLNSEIKKLLVLKAFDEFIKADADIIDYL